MASLRRTSTVSQPSLPTLTSHREQQASEPTEIEAFLPKELPPLPHLEDEIAYPPAGTKDYIARKPLLPEDATSGPIASTVGGLVAGIALAISHHVFLTFLNGRNIDEYPQYWVKNANNAFSAILSLCIAFVATSSLIQMKWNAARSKPLSIRSIDNLFALPSPVALFTTVTSTRLWSLKLFLLPILTGVFIQSLALVSVFAPNALTVARSAEISQDIIVPTLDLSTGPLTSILYWTATWNISQEWNALLTSAMLQPPILNWKIPLGCGAACKFDLVYDGPGLQCMDTPLESLPYTSPYTPYGPPFTGPYPLYYNATSTLYRNRGVRYMSLWEIVDQYELRIGYIATDNDGFRTGLDGGSVYCVFRNATYKASFQAENNTMQVNHTIQSYGGILGTIKHDEHGSLIPQCGGYGSDPCDINGINMRVMCDVFASAFAGTMEFANITGGVNTAVTDLLFSHKPEYIFESFHLAVSNLSNSLVDLFSNLTLGFIPTRDDVTTVQAEIWDGSYAWSYTVWILWAVYLPTLLLASLVMLNGLLSIRSNKRGMNDKFSNFLLATKDIDLDVVCINTAEFEEFQRLRLLYQREKGTFSVVSGASEEVVEI